MVSIGFGQPLIIPLCYYVGIPQPPESQSIIDTWSAQMMKEARTMRVARQQRQVTIMLPSVRNMPSRRPSVKYSHMSLNQEKYRAGALQE
jgi:hypothetical protein